MGELPGALFVLPNDLAMSRRPTNDRDESRNSSRSAPSPCYADPIDRSAISWVTSVSPATRRNPRAT